MSVPVGCRVFHVEHTEPWYSTALDTAIVVAVWALIAVVAFLLIARFAERRADRKAAP